MRLRVYPRVVLIAWFVFYAPLVNAQTSSAVCTDNCVLARNQPFTVAFTHDGAETAGYKLYVNNVYTLGSPAGTLQFAFPQGIASAGTYMFQVTAYNANGVESDKSDATGATVQAGKPSKPGKPRILASLFSRGASVLGMRSQRPAVTPRRVLFTQTITVR